MTQVAGKTVLITGAGMGMGQRHAQVAAERGARRIILWDINQDAAEQTAEPLRRSGTRADTFRVDVSSVDQIDDAADRVQSEIGPVEILFNNAGIVTPGAFMNHSARDIDRTIQVNTLGIMHVARAFLPAMVRTPSAHLVNISSASALMPLPYGSVYAASKWAAYCWSESLRIELEDSHPHVKVTTVCPAFVATGMFEGASAPRSTRFLTTDEIVSAIWKGLEKNRPIVMAPAMTRIVLPLRAFLPLSIFDFLGRNIFKSYSAMKTLKGRGPAPSSPPHVPSPSRASESVHR
ncbi:SDR family NAD(P)-dependent oxidoreductase [bacterium]|nr:SDR family NAD(P)-dependent oxidoreductase [bacterium]